MQRTLFYNITLLGSLVCAMLSLSASLAFAQNTGEDVPDLQEPTPQERPQEEPQPTTQPTQPAGQPGTIQGFDPNTEQPTALPTAPGEPLVPPGGLDQAPTTPQDPNVISGSDGDDTLSGGTGPVQDDPIGGAAAAGARDSSLAAGENKPLNLTCIEWYLGVNPDQCAAMIGYYGFLWPISWITWLAGVLLNFAVFEGVVRMGANVNSLVGINEAWTVLRDLANIVFVFALIAIGISTILRIDTFGWKRLLANLVIAALLVNFSLFFTKLVIDVSNMFAREAFAQIPVEGACSSGNEEERDECLDGGLSGTFMQHLSILTLFERATSENPDDPTSISNLDPWKIAIASLGGGVFMLVAAFVFAAGALMLAGRFVVLIVLMIFSPLAFAAWVLPFTRGYATSWIRMLFSQSFFAPAFLLMVWITVTIIESFQENFAFTNVDNFASALVGNASAIVIIFNYLLIIGFMMLSLVVAQRFGAYGATGAIKMGRSMGGYAVGTATFGAAAAGLRSTIGGRAAAAAKSEQLKERMAQGGFRGAAAKTQYRMYQGLAGASFDTRRVAGMGKKYGLGQGQKGGYKEREEAYKKRYSQMGDELRKSSPTEPERARLSDIRTNMANAQRQLAEAQDAEQRYRSIGAPEQAQAMRRQANARRQQIKQFENEIKRINQGAEARGAGRAERFAGTLGEVGILTGGAKHRGAEAAAGEIRTKKSNLDKLKEAAKGLSEEEAEQSEETPEEGETGPESSP